MDGALLDRRSAVKTLLEARGELLVVTGLGSPSYDAFAAGDHDSNFYLWGAMGGAALMGLGLALAQPTRPVAVLTGDGEQLMGMGGLATIAVKQPRNLSLIVLDNGHYGETGMQKSHAGLGVDLCAVARSTGFPHCIDISTEEELLSAREAIVRVSGGPSFYRVRIRAENAPRALPSRDGVFLKNRFRSRLGLSVN